MTDLKTYEDMLLEAGQPVPRSIPCPICNRSKRPFELAEVEPNSFKCSQCIIEEKRLFIDLHTDDWTSLNGEDAKAQRNQLLNKYAWTVSPASPLSEACQAAFLEYLKELNALTVTYDRPSKVIWPEVPVLEYE